MTAGIELIPDNLILRESFKIVQARILVSKPIPFKREFFDATMGPFKALTLASIQLIDEDGTEGQAPFAIRGGADLYHKELFPALLNMNMASHDEIIKNLYWIMRNYGFRDSASSAVSSIDLALYDIASKRHSMTVHRLLGAKKDSCLVYGSGGGVNLSESELLAEMEELYDLSCGIVKMKIKPDPQDWQPAYERIQKVRNHLGPDAKLAFDINQRFSAEDAIEFAHVVQDLDIEWFEEPVHSADLHELRDFCEESPIPVSLGESERTSRVFPMIHEMGAKHLQPQVHKMGSVSEWLDIKDLCERKGLQLSSGGIAPLAAQVITACDESYAMCEFLRPTMGDIHKYMKTPPRMAGGRYHLEHEAGLGMDYDWEGMAQSDMIKIDLSC